MSPDSKKVVKKVASEFLWCGLGAGIKAVKLFTKHVIVTRKNANKVLLKNVLRSTLIVGQHFCIFKSCKV